MRTAKAGLYRPHALPVAKPTVSRYGRNTVVYNENVTLPQQ